MALKIHKATSTPSAGIVADRRLCLTADRSRVVEDGDPESAFLFATQGDLIPAAEVERLGLEIVEGEVHQVAPKKRTQSAEEGGEGDETPSPETPAPDTPSPETAPPAGEAPETGDATDKPRPEAKPAAKPPRAQQGRSGRGR